MIRKLTRRNSSMSKIGDWKNWSNPAKWPDGLEPFQYAIHCIGGKWKLILLHMIYNNNGKIRFNEAMRMLPITDKMLGGTLRQMMADGLIERISYDEMPPKVEYILTPDAEALIPLIESLFSWCIQMMKKRNITIKNDYSKCISDSSKNSSID